MKKILSILLAVATLISGTVFASGEANTATPTFTDVAADSASASAIYKLVQAGVINGYGDGTFKPNKDLTRAELVKIINLAFGYTEKDETGFTDLQPTDWYYEHALIAKKAGYIKGFPDGSFGGRKMLTREQVCAVISRCAGLMKLELGITISDAISPWAVEDVYKVVTNQLMPLEANNTFRATQKIIRAELAQVASYFVGTTTPETQPGGNQPSTGGNTGGSTGGSTGGNSDGVVSGGTRPNKPEIISYVVSAAAATNGKIMVNGVELGATGITVNNGTDLEIVFEPVSGYRVKSVTVNDVDKTMNVINNKLALTIRETTKITAAFEKIPEEIKTFKLSAETPKNGKIKVDDKELTSTGITVNDGTGVEVVFEPAAGYALKSVKVNDTEMITDVNENKLALSITANAKIVATFERTFNVTVTAPKNGKIKVDGEEITSIKVADGTEKEITFEGDADYELASVKVNGKEMLSSVKNYTLKIKVEADTTITATFKKITYKLTATATNGKVKADGKALTSTGITLDVNTQKEVSFEPSAGYKLASVKINGTEVSVTNGKLTVTMEGDRNIVAVFERITYKLTATATNGTVKTDGKALTSSGITVNSGTTKEITFEPSSGYELKTVKVNGTDKTSGVKNNKLSVTIEKDTTITADFTKIKTDDGNTGDTTPPTPEKPTTTPKLSATAANGKVELDGAALTSTGVTVNKGTEKIVKITSNAGYTITSVKVNGVDVTGKVGPDGTEENPKVEENELLLENITKDTEIVVECEKNKNAEVVTHLEAVINLWLKPPQKFTSDDEKVMIPVVTAIGRMLGRKETFTLTPEYVKAACRSEIADAKAGYQYLVNNDLFGALTTKLANLHGTTIDFLYEYFLMDEGVDRDDLPI